MQRKRHHWLSRNRGWCPKAGEGAEFPLGDVFTWPCLPQIKNQLCCYGLVLLGQHQRALA